MKNEIPTWIRVSASVLLVTGGVLFSGMSYVFATFETKETASKRSQYQDVALEKIDRKLDYLIQRIDRMSDRNSNK